MATIPQVGCRLEINPMAILDPGAFIGNDRRECPEAYTFMLDCSKERSLVTGAKDYSYLNATMGSTRMARRAGM
jgi:hypothetical protein